MKIEPIKKTSLPKYAAALAALCTVPMLSGCSRSVDIAGMEAVYTEPYDSVLELVGEESIDPGYLSSEPDTSAADGNPDAETEPKEIDAFAEDCEAAFLEAFERQGMDVQTAPLQSGSFDLVQAEYGETNFDVAFLSKHSLDDNLAVCFYDGRALLTDWNSESGDTESTCAAFFAYYAERGAKEFGWGYADVAMRWDTKDNWAPGRTAFIDISRFDTLNADEAEQIIEDVRSAFAQEGAESNEA